jgi:hypothetical protein
VEALHKEVGCRTCLVLYRVYSLVVGCRCLEEMVRQLCLKAKTEGECACYYLSLWSLLGSVIYLEQPLLIHFGKSERVTTVYSLPKGEEVNKHDKILLAR